MEVVFVPEVPVYANPGFLEQNQIFVEILLRRQQKNINPNAVD